DGVIVGTPAYMAPEQAAGRSDQIGPWTDLYAVGVVLYQMLTGRLPFEGPAAAVLAAVVHDEPPPLRRFPPGLDPDLQAARLRARRKAPAERPADARVVAAELARWAAPAAASPPPPSADVTVNQRPASETVALPPRRRWVARLAGWLAGAAC